MKLKSLLKESNSAKLHDALTQFDGLIDTLKGLEIEGDSSHPNIVIQSIISRVEQARKVLDRDYIKKYHIPLKQK